MLKDIYGEYSDQDMVIRVYSDRNCSYKELTYSGEELKALNFRIEFEKEVLHDIEKFGMYTVFSDYPGFFVYSLTENKNGSIAIEHGF